MRRMERSLAQVVLVLLALFATRDGFAWECKHRLLSDEERWTLVDVVQKTSGLAANQNSIRACRNWSVVEVETVRERQADGTERRSWLQCSAAIKTYPDRWICVDHPARGFRADTYPGELGVWVTIDDLSSLTDARADVSLAFALLERGGDIQPCKDVSGKSRTVAGLRAEMTGGDGNIVFWRSAGEFSIQGGYVVVDFERVDPTRARIECWRFPEILVTS